MTTPDIQLEPQLEPQASPEPPATPALELLKRQLRKPKTLLPLGGAVLFVAFIAGVCIFGGGGTIPAAAQAPAPQPASVATPEPAGTPTPTPEPAPTATPVAFPSLIPDRQEEYRTYRYYHFLYEYNACFGEGEADYDLELETLASLPESVDLLLSAYSENVCQEPVFFAIYEGRLKWFLHWRQ